MPLPTLRRTMMMNDEEERVRLKIFNRDTHVVTYGTVNVYNIGLEPYELDNIFAHLDLEGSSWQAEDFKIDGGKHYDEEGNSYIFGCLSISTKGRDHQDFMEFEQRWTEAEKEEAGENYGRF